jgi:hypothetical protein
MLRNGFDIPHDYKSQFRPAQLKQYKKPSLNNNPGYNQKISKTGSSSYEKPSIVPTAT